MEKWPLTMVMRWAPTPNSFTLDFGTYRESKYSVQTLEGEQIAQLISGYIDIILKRVRLRAYSPCSFLAAELCFSNELLLSVL